MGERRGLFKRKSSLVLGCGAAALVAAIGAFTAGGAASAQATPDSAREAASGDTRTASSPGGSDASPTADSSAFPLPDPDTVLAEDGRYVTYGTTVPGDQGERCEGATGELYVPILVHGSGNDVGMTDCASGDALPGGPGAWAEGAIWAPGVARYGDRFFMYYTASRAGTGQKCVGRAVSTSAYGPFQNQGEWACPPAGRWAIDANPFVSDGQLYVTYRDDEITEGDEIGLSTVRTDAEGWAIWDTRRDVLKSTDIDWDDRDISGPTHVVENPSMFQTPDGRWYLMYSGNNWDSDRYATGIADCGTTPLPENRCTPIGDGVARPYFGYTGETGLDPLRGLPENRPGPGGMDVFTAADGTFRVVWHWYDGTLRYPMTGVLEQDADGFTVR